jgi:hypothetical protein
LGQVLAGFQPCKTANFKVAFPKLKFWESLSYVQFFGLNLMRRLGSKGGGSPFVKAMENKKSSEIALRLNRHINILKR